MVTDSYFGRSARIVFNDPTWWWRTPVLALIGMVPILGTVVILGYQMVLMRDVAWGVERGLPRFNESSEILSRGWIGFVVSLVWGLILIPLVIIAGVALVLVQLPAIMASPTSTPPSTPWWFVALVTLPSIAINVFAMVAVLRAAIYMQTSAGLSLAAVRDLIGRAKSGFVHVSVLMVSVALLGLVLALPATYLRQIAYFPAALGLPLTYAAGFVLRLITAPLSLIVACAYGLWARQTDVASWPPLAPMTADTHPATAGRVEQALQPDAPGLE